MKMQNSTNNTTQNIDQSNKGIPRWDIPFGVLQAPIEEFWKFYHMHFFWDVYIDEKLNRFVFKSEENETDIQKEISSYFYKNFFSTEELRWNPDTWNLYYISMMELNYWKFLREEFLKNKDPKIEINYFYIYFNFLMGISHYKMAYNYYEYSQNLSDIFLDFIMLLKKYYHVLEDRETLVRNFINMFNYSFYKKICVLSQKAVIEVYDISVILEFDKYEIETLPEFYYNLEEVLRIAIRTFHEPKWKKKYITLNEQLNDYINIDNKTNKHILENYIKDVTEKRKTIERSDSESILVKREEILSSLKSNIIWQDKVIDTIYPLFLKTYIWLNKRPTSLLFAGDSWVGKTQLWIEIANIMGIEPLIINMGNLEHSSGMSMLLWSPPGYMDSNTPTILEDYANYIYEKTREWNKTILPVLIFDEIEKANNKIYNLWLELLDRGTITLLKWVTIDFSDAIIILTSNLWSKRDTEIWFTIERTEDEEQEIIDRHYDSEIRWNLPIEIVNRLERIVVFNSLTTDDYKKIRDNIVKKTVVNLAENNALLQKVLWEKKENVDNLISKIMQEISEEFKDVDTDIKNIRLSERYVEDKILNYILTMY